jgi:hypothetical protein
MARLATRDAIAGLLCLALSLWLFSLTFGLPRSPFVPVGPEFYPRIVLAVTGVLSFAVLVQGIMAAWRGEQPMAAPRNFSKVLVAFAVFWLYIAAMPYLGYRIATVLFVVVLQAVLERPVGLRKWAIVVAIAVVTTIVTFIVFEHYLTVLLPRGRWTAF